MSSVGRVTSLDTERIRTHFPALALGVAHFDGPGGSQTPTEVAEAVAAAMTSGVSNRGTITDAELRAERIVADARAALGALLGADPRGVVFGRSMTALTFDLARTLSADWGPGDEIVVTRLDHDANIRPWVLWAERAGATVRWLGFDPDTAELDDLETVLSTRTRLVAVTGASNLFGTRPDVTAISRAAHEVDAARVAVPGQAPPFQQRRARAVRARHAALRAAGRRHRLRRLHRRPGAGRRHRPA